VSVDWTVTTGDCLDPLTGLASLADKSVDHVITDPPYAANIVDNMRSASPLKFNGNVLQKGLNYPTEVGYVGLPASTMCELSSTIGRITRRWTLVFRDVESTDKWRIALTVLGHLEYIRTGAWIRTNVAPQFTGDRPAAGFDAFVLAHPSGRKRWNGGGRHSVYNFQRDVNGAGVVKRIGQKPVELMEALIRDFTDPGDLICDPFCGSGTTGVAALRLGRRFIGWELNETWAATARKRLSETREQLGLFAAEDSA
jgi:hypothetical protein